LPSPSSRGRRKVPQSPVERSLKMTPNALKYSKAETIVATIAWYRNGMYLHEYRLVIHLSSSSVDICYPLEMKPSCESVPHVGFLKGLTEVRKGCF
jgi:hypothetical protein